MIFKVKENANQRELTQIILQLFGFTEQIYHSQFAVIHGRSAADGTESIPLFIRVDSR